MKKQTKIIILAGTAILFSCNKSFTMKKFFKKIKEFTKVSQSNTLEKDLIFKKQTQKKKSPHVVNSFDNTVLSKHKILIKEITSQEKKNKAPTPKLPQKTPKKKKTLTMSNESNEESKKLQAKPNFEYGSLFPKFGNFIQEITSQEKKTNKKKKTRTMSDGAFEKLLKEFDEENEEFKKNQAKLQEIKKKES